MLSNLKLSTIGWVFFATMIITGVTITSASFLVERNITVINTAWTEFQTDRSEKAMLENALRSAIGYGGMIHNFKNYILRQKKSYHIDTHSNIGAAHSILHQYADLEITSAEAIAIEDIENVLDDYLKALQLAEKLIKQKSNTTLDIDKAVKIDDSFALRGLVTLRKEVRAAMLNGTKLSKGRIVADLRAAIGYGGMIHEFKNYILRREAASVEKINGNLKDAQVSIERYHKLTPNHAELIALKDIESTLLAYTNGLKKISTLIAENKPLHDLDSAARVNDTAALRALHILQREINAQVTEDSRSVTTAFKVVKQTMQLATWSVLILIVVIMLISIWLLRAHVITPIMLLTKHMTQLANNKLDIKITNKHQKNEIGEMARSVVFFKENMIKRREAEHNLKIANDEMSERYKDIKQLRERADEQTGKALSLAEGLSAAREAAEKAMSRAEADEQFVSSILNTVRDGIIAIDSRGIIESFNPGAEEIFGFKTHEVIGKNISILMPEPHRSAHDEYLKTYLDGKSTRDQNNPMEQIALRKNGETVSVEVTLNAMQFANEVKFTGLVRDITERKKWEEKIKLMAMTDPLTGLANRNQYNQRLEDTMKQALRFKMQFALMQIDLDKFKPVNDTYGHPVGDALLQHVAKILDSSCRDIDTVARLGGDEFAIILNGINHLEDVVISAERIIEKLSSPVMIENHNIQIGASIGISNYPSDSTDIEELIRMADEALYFSKQEGRNTYRIYSKIQAVKDTK